MPLLLPYSANTQALSATTAEVVNGSRPYLTFDNGVTKVTTTDSLLGITLSDGSFITPATNTSTATNPIVLPNAGETLANVQMLVPISADSITLNHLIGAPNNYWGDDDGDGQGPNGITITGNLKVNITDKENQIVSRSAVLDICQAPYKVVLSTTNGSLTTQYGWPNSNSFTGSSATYYIKPKALPKICYARPNLTYGTNGQERPGFNFAGPANIWTPKKGFLPQSTESSTYSRNFPTTGANNLYFDLDIGGINGSTLTWPTVIKGGITATMKPTPSQPNNIRVTLTGPSATASQINSASPGSVSTPNLPQQFEIVGYDSSHTVVLKYGFVLKQWFVNRGEKWDSYPNTSSWCSSIHYHMPQVKDLTNAVCSGFNAGYWCQGAVGAKPLSSGNHLQRNIGAGLFSEWGIVKYYANAGFVYFYYWAGDSYGSDEFYVYSYHGGVSNSSPSESPYGVCVYP